MDWAALHHGSTGNCATTSRNGVANRCADRTMVRNRPKGVMVETKDHYVVSSAELGGGSDEGIEHRLETNWRARDDTQDFRGRGVLLLRFRECSGQLLDPAFRLIVGGRSCHDYTRFLSNLPRRVRAASWWAANGGMGWMLRDMVARRNVSPRLRY